MINIMPPRLAEVVAGLCAVSDLSRGLADGQGLRACRVAMALADLLPLDEADRTTLYWVSLLRFVGCTATASDMATALGDELRVSSRFAVVDAARLPEVFRAASDVAGLRPDRLLGFLAKAPAVVADHEITSCEVARTIAETLDLPAEVSVALGQVFERFDGKGHPGRVRGEALHPAVRLWQVAHTIDLLRQDLDLTAVADQLRRRAGTALDPVFAAAAAAADALRTLPESGNLTAVLDAEPGPVRWLSDESIEAAFGVFGLVADAKSPYFRGHSRRVANLAASAAAIAGRTPAEIDEIRRAGLVHDAGKAAISSRIWNATGELSDADQEQVRLHPYFTHRVLCRVPALAGLAELAGSHHERSGGTGYHRGIEPSPPAAILAAADVYVTAGEPRPHRPAAAANAQLEVLRATRLPTEAVEAVAEAAGHRPVPVRRDTGPLTSREIEVLQLVATGLTNAALGRRLGISAKTVNTHLEHAYDKLRVSTRVAAVVVATHHGWLV